MACESCIVYVKDALQELNLSPTKVVLGEVEIKGDLSEPKKLKFESIINKVGLEIVENKGAILIDQIKNYCHEYALHEKDIKVNISDFLAKKTQKDYNYISNLFSDIELCTIIHYISLIKMEKAKEMILFEDHNLTEVAHKLNYSTLSAFSTQFKKITGFNPTHFKNLKIKRRLTIQNLTKENL